MPQDVELFAGTVAENIARLGEVDATKVVRAARRAHAHEMILALPKGYDTVVDPQAALLVARAAPTHRAGARAVRSTRSLLVLDEPNANLDGAGEHALGEALDDARAAT